MCVCEIACAHHGHPSRKGWCSCSQEIFSRIRRLRRPSEQPVSTRQQGIVHGTRRTRSARLPPCPKPRGTSICGGFCRHASTGKWLTKRDVVGLQDLLARRLGLGKHDRAEALTRGGVGAVVDARDASAEGEGEVGLDVRDLHVVKHNRLEVPHALGAAIKRRELFLPTDTHTGGPSAAWLCGKVDQHGLNGTGFLLNRGRDMWRTAGRGHDLPAGRCSGAPPARVPRYHAPSASRARSETP